MDPDAQYTQTVADLGLQEQWENSGLSERKTNLEANTGYLEKQREGAEPGAFRANANRANRGGLLESGTNWQRHGDIAQRFSERRTANQNALTQGLASITHAGQGVGLKRTQGEHVAIQNRDNAKAEEARRNAILAVTQPQAAPAAPAALPAQNAGPGVRSASGATGGSDIKTYLGKQYRVLNNGTYEWLSGPGVKRVISR